MTPKWSRIIRVYVSRIVRVYVGAMVRLIAMSVLRIVRESVWCHLALVMINLKIPNSNLTCSLKLELGAWNLEFLENNRLTDLMPSPKNQTENQPCKHKQNGNYLCLC